MKKSRIMQYVNNDYTKIKVIRHFIATCPVKSEEPEPYWEYYIIDEPEMEFPEGSTIRYAFVLGWHNEFGTVDLKDLEKRAITDTTDLSEVKPAPDWRWID